MGIEVDGNRQPPHLPSSNFLLQEDSDGTEPEVDTKNQANDNIRTLLGHNQAPLTTSDLSSHKQYNGEKSAPFSTAEFLPPEV